MVTDFDTNRKRACDFLLVHNSNIIGHFGDESFQAITCTGTDNTKQTEQNTPKKHKTQHE